MKRAGPLWPGQSTAAVTRRDAEDYRTVELPTMKKGSDPHD